MLCLQIYQTRAILICLDVIESILHYFKEERTTGILEHTEKSCLRTSGTLALFGFFYKFIHVESKTSKMRTCMCIHIAYTKGLVTNYGEGGLQNGRRGAREVLPL